MGNTMDHEAFERAASYWDRKDGATPAEQRMAPAELRGAVEAFIQDHNTCALATGAAGQVRCTPLEYTYHDGAFWIFSEGGRKFRGLAENPHVGLAVFEPYGGFGTLKSLQVDGTATVLVPGDAEYAAAAAFRNIPLDALRKLPEPMYLIKIVPEHLDYLDSDLKQRGLATRQHLDLA